MCVSMMRAQIMISRYECESESKGLSPTLAHQPCLIDEVTMETWTPKRSNG